MILGIKIDRRLIGAVGLEADRLAFLESRYVTFRLQTFQDYFARLLAQVQPKAIYCYTPFSAESTAIRVTRCLQAAAQHAQIPVRTVAKPELLGSFGISPFRRRADMADHISEIWPSLSETKAQRRVAVTEAVAAAMIGEVREFLPTP